MELVDGVPVTTYCAERRLSLEDRLRLFRDVCGAVQDAHQHGVVHRDLKPANILVTPTACRRSSTSAWRSSRKPRGTESEPTVTGALRPLTPNYASPEQVRGLPVPRCRTSTLSACCSTSSWPAFARTRPPARPSTSSSTSSATRNRRGRAPARAAVSLTSLRPAPAAGRSRRHRAEGDEQGPGASIRVGQGAGRRRDAASHRHARARARAVVRAISRPSWRAGIGPPSCRPRSRSWRSSPRSASRSGRCGSR